MIPASYVTGWRLQNPWPDDAQVEQDLIICRALVEIFQVPKLYEAFAFRGGTALHKLHIKRPIRYSEDIDLVQVREESSGSAIDAIRKVLDPWLGTPKRERAENSFKLIYRIDSEGEPPRRIRLKIEVNTREHFTLSGYKDVPFEVQSRWFSGKTTINTFALEELLATKMRALYQRKKGRDLLDLWLGLTQFNLDRSKLVSMFQEYLKRQDLEVTRAEFLANLEEKMVDHKFIGDTNALLAVDFTWSMPEAKRLIESDLIALLPNS